MDILPMSLPIANWLICMLEMHNNYIRVLVCEDYYGKLLLYLDIINACREILTPRSGSKSYRAIGLLPGATVASHDGQGNLSGTYTYASALMR